MAEQHSWNVPRAEFVMVLGDEPLRLGGQIFFPGLRYSATNAVVRANKARFTEVASRPVEDEPTLERLADPED